MRLPLFNLWGHPPTKRIKSLLDSCVLLQANRVVKPCDPRLELAFLDLEFYCVELNISVANKAPMHAFQCGGQLMDYCKDKIA